jgi:hypothetical protein
MIAELNSIGIWIIGAEAIVDLESDISKQTFAYLSREAPCIEPTEKSFQHNYKEGAFQ